MIHSHKSYLLLLILIITHPHCTPLTDYRNELQFQNDCLLAAGHPMVLTPLQLVAKQKLGIGEGKNPQKFSLYLPEGPYNPVLETNLGTYYLSPLEGFGYYSREELKSQIGGIFVTHSVKPRYIGWYIPDQISGEEWANWRLGYRVDKARASILELGVRPWVDRRFEINRGYIKTAAGREGL